MPSNAGEPARERARLRSMASRVAVVVLTSAALGGLAASVVAILAVDRLIADQADQRLRAATVTLAGELDEDRDRPDREAVRETIEDENDEIVTSGIRLAVFEAGELFAGDAWMFAPAPDSCRTRLIAGERIRACAAQYQTWLLVAAQPIDTTTLHWLYVLAAAGAVGLGAAVGAVSSVGLSRWAVGPLRDLSQTLRSSRAEALGSLALDARGDYEEVEAIRAALRDLSARVQTLLDHASRFAADAAHELRSPLTALRAELELLSEESAPPERAAIDRACERVVRLSELLDRLLVLALPTEHVHEGFETVALSDIVEQVVSELPAENAHRIELELTSEGLVRGDAPLLRSLISNALQNALKFAPDGRVTLRVDERASRDLGAGNAEVALEVTDEGPGVPEALHTRVFTPFYRAAPGAAPGHGIGLALIGHIARAHAGRARFVPRERGARLLVELPSWSDRASV